MPKLKDNLLTSRYLGNERKKCAHHCQHVYINKVYFYGIVFVIAVHSVTTKPILLCFFFLSSSSLSFVQFIPNIVSETVRYTLWNHYFASVIYLVTNGNVDNILSVYVLRYWDIFKCSYLAVFLNLHPHFFHRYLHTWARKFTFPR